MPERKLVHKFERSQKNHRKWRDHYNCERPHSSPGGQTPRELASQLERKASPIGEVLLTETSMS